MAKHSEKRGRRKVIRLEDHLPQHQATPAQEPSPPEEASPEEAPQATIEYGEEEAAAGEQKKARQVPKALYRVAVVLLVLVLGLAIWVNRGNLTPQNICNWIQVQITGTGEGDGYPVAITGSSVSEGNFLSAEGNAVALSDTALTILGPSGQELFSQRHSYNQPILKAASGQYLLYNQNSTGYMVVSGTQLHLESSTEQDILAGAIAPNGRFALATQGADGATDVTVYLATGEEQFTYSFAQDYVTALALNADGTWAMVCLPPFSCSSSQRRRARTATSAVKKIFTSAWGRTTVPISRPSMMTLFLRASARCTSSKNSRTTFCAEISDAAWDISGVRISSVTSAPLRIICCTPASS